MTTSLALCSLAQCSRSQSSGCCSMLTSSTSSTTPGALQATSAAQTNLCTLQSVNHMPGASVSQHLSLCPCCCARKMFCTRPTPTITTGHSAMCHTQFSMHDVKIGNLQHLASSRRWLPGACPGCFCYALLARNTSHWHFACHVQGTARS